MKKRMLSLLLILGMVFALAVNASAADMPDLDQKGSLEFAMDVDGVLLDSGALNVYYVADIVLVEGNRYDFRQLKELTDAGAKLDTGDLYDDAQAEALFAIAKRTLPDYRTSPIEDGKAFFADLDAGLYLVWQNEADASEGYSAIQPFLISVPRWQNGEYAMNVKADPKVPFETEPGPPPPPPPPPPPKTGQLNWPVPVMAVSGMTLFIAGWILCSCRKRIENEK